MGQPEVGNLGTPVAKQNVVAFNIAVEHARLVKERQALSFHEKQPVRIVLQQRKTFVVTVGNRK